MGVLRDIEGGVRPYVNRRDISFNVLLSSLDVDMLGALGARLRVSKGQVLRQALSSMYLMVCEDQPTCASGQGCFMAHLHNRQGVVPHMSDAPARGVTMPVGSERGEGRG